MGIWMIIYISISARPIAAHFTLPDSGEGLFQLSLDL
jgi:hypothetical protein